MLCSEMILNSKGLGSLAVVCILQVVQSNLLDCVMIVSWDMHEEQNKDPHFLHSNGFFTTFEQILQMNLLPGGEMKRSNG